MGDDIADLENGKTLADTIRLASTAVVVVDQAGVPFRRLWCLYEMASMPQDKMVLLSAGMQRRQLNSAIAAINCKKAECYKPTDRAIILGHIRAQYGGQSAAAAVAAAGATNAEDSGDASLLAAFDRTLRLRFMLEPLAFEQDIDALIGRSGGDDFSRLSELWDEAKAGGASVLHCVVANSGEVRSGLRWLVAPLSACRFFVQFAAAFRAVC